MDLYLIRHAEAIPAEEGGFATDAERPLTPRGFAQARALAEFFQRQRIPLKAIFTSPLLRTRQTSEEMVRAWPDSAPEIVECLPLAPGGKRKKLARQLRELNTAATALVGHEPDLSWLAGWLIGNRAAQLSFDKGGVAYLQSDGKPNKGTCTLLWFLTAALVAGETPTSCRES